MKRHLTLHIGTEKTGSTSIQYFLNQNRQRLFDAGLGVPSSLGDEIHYKLQLMSNSDDFSDNFLRALNLHRDLQARKKAIQGWREEFVSEVKGSPVKRWIISCETLHSRIVTRPELENLKSLLQSLFSEIDIVVYLRDPVQMAISRMSEMAKAALPLQLMPAEPSKGFDIFDHRGTTKFWDGALGPGKFHPRLFEQSSLVQGNVVCDLCSIIGIDQKGLELPERKNVSIPFYAVRLLDQLNRYVPRHWTDGTSIPSRWQLVSLVMEALKTGDPIKPTENEIEYYRKTYMVSNEWVRKKYFPDRKKLFAGLEGTAKNEVGLTEDQYHELAQLIATIWLNNNAKIKQLQERLSYLESYLDRTLDDPCAFYSAAPSVIPADYLDC